MAKLEEIRKWARGKKVKGLPEPIRRELVRKPQLGKTIPIWMKAKFVISADGTDVLLQFGKYRGSRLSDLVKTARGRTYLNWIMRHEFPEDLKEVCRYRLERWKREKRR